MAGRHGRGGGKKPRFFSGANLFDPRAAGRDFFVLGVIAVFLIVIAARLFYVQVVKGPEYASDAEDVQVSTIALSARRGTIYDRNGEVLASDVAATTVYVNPAEVTEPQNLAQILADTLGERYDMSADDYYALVTKTDTTFVYIQRKCDRKLASKLRKQLNSAGIAGIHYLDDTKRVYPNGTTGSQVVGSVDVDGKGIAGLEMQYNDLVGGTDGSETLAQGANGTPIAGGTVSKTDAVDGEDITISLDIRLQEKVEKSLKKAVAKYSAKGGSATVMDAKTGEIYASASYAKSNGSYQLEVGKLGAATDAYEPGSTFKAVTAASILRYSSVTPSTSFTVPGKLKVYDATIRDSHSHGTQSMSLRQIIAESSNIGTVLASRKVSLSQLYKTYRRFGFGQDPGTDFPGVTAGQLQKSSEWNGVQAANITFGQGVLVSGLQTLRAYGAIEQGGTERVPHFLTGLPTDSERSGELLAPLEKSKKVTTSSISKDLTSMMKSVVTDGTGTDAAVSGFSVAGKTGTAEVASSTGGYGDGYIVSFAGWLAGSSSDLVCLVTVDHPKTEEGGGPVCGPVFADIMSFAADRYQVAPNEG